MASAKKRKKKGAMEQKQQKKQPSVEFLDQHGHAGVAVTETLQARAVRDVKSRRASRLERSSGRGAAHAATVARRAAVRAHAAYMAKARIAEQLMKELQEVCPHDKVIECPEHEEFRDGLGFPPTPIEAMRRCEHCLLEEGVSKRGGSVLFSRPATSTMLHPEFKETKPPSFLWSACRFLYERQ